MPEIHYFTQAGRARWLQWLEDMKAQPAKDFPDDLLADPICTRRIAGRIIVPDVGFATKYSLAETLTPAIKLLRQSNIPEASWHGLWDWLAAYYFNSICPFGTDGARKPKELARYSFDPSWKRRHRHRICGPIDLFARFGSSSRLFLHGPPSTLTDWEEQTASRQLISAEAGIAEAMFRLYWDHGKGAPKQGASPNSHQRGTIRRFHKIMQQLSRTFDLSTMTSDAILDLLPSEFSRFRG